MIINDKQSDKLVKLLLYLKQNRYYCSELSKYSEEDIINNADKVYASFKMTTKNSLLENLDTVLSNSVIGAGKASEIVNDIMDVDQLSENHDRVINLEGNKWYIEMTSGTSGKPFPVVKSEYEKYIEAAYLLKCRRRICSDATLANSFMLIHPIDEKIKNISHRGYKAESFERIITYMEERKPVWIFTGVNLLTFLGDYIISSNQVTRVQKIGIKFIETTSQKMDDIEKKKYEKIFGACIVSNYGCREVWNIAYECPCGQMHINSEYLLVDIVDDNGNCLAENEVGNVALTSLSNMDMPLVKYIIGDRARITKSECKCGKKEAIIYLEDSRKEELIEGTSRNGTAIFRKILRRIYFHDKIRDIEAIKIIQDDVWKFTIYVDRKNKEDTERFETLFMEQASKNIENVQQYIFSFNYEYPFKDTNYMEKEKIFRNVIRQR